MVARLVWLTARSSSAEVRTCRSSSAPSRALHLTRRYTNTCIGVGGKDGTTCFSTYLKKSKEDRSSRLQVLLHFPLVSWARRGGQCLSA